MIQQIKAKSHEGAFVLGLIRKVGTILLDTSAKRLMNRTLRNAGVGDASQIFSYTKPVELEMLYALARNCPVGSNALEIGSHLGASSCYLGAGIKERGGRLFCVDTWHNETMPEGDQDTYSRFRMNTSGLGETVVPIRKHSSEMNLSDLQKPLALIFIDGDHSYEGVKSDFERTIPWLEQGGIVAFHDTVAFEGVCRLMGEALASGSFRIKGHTKNLSWIRKL